ncbi:polyphosphate kinase 2 family protein [Flavihumibacter solisilvae]|uniref:polyphosphate kinase 2 family protein n=1 Tax=Flavihumibacter solisilvae TaxID=1349421 RepID=UPI0009E5E990|nr:polyphosphate kinase 2 family protein [Flavihumibacter solisilvae]
MKDKDNKDKIRVEEINALNKKELIKRAKKFSQQFCVSDGDGFRLKDFDPSEDGGIGPEGKAAAKEILQQGVEALAAMQDILYAQDRWAILLIFQAMDAAGKDGAIKHVMSGVNPQGCHVTSYKAPSAEDLDHDYMWRCTKNLPERGRIGIFNRSYYEEVLVVRVHEKLLRSQKLPEELITKDIWEDRLKDIRNFERYLNRNGVLVCKFFLNVSRKEQKKRFLERIENPDKNWKFSASDARERKYWKDYMEAYEDLITHTATKNSPWYVVPADNKAFGRIVVASAIINTLDSLGLEYPKLSEEKLAELQAVKQELLAEE